MATMQTTQVGSIRARRPNQQIGEVFPALHLVRTSWLVRMVGRVTFVALAISIVAMFFAPWQQTSRGFGTVVAIDPQLRPQSVQSQYDGVITWVRPDLIEGATVKAGDEVMRLEPIAANEVEQLRLQLAQVRDALKAAQFNLELAKQNIELQKLSGGFQVTSAQSEVEAAERKLDQSKAQVVEIQAELTFKERELKLANDIIGKGLVAGIELQEKINAVAGSKAKLDKANGFVSENENLLASKKQALDGKIRDLDIKNREAEAKAQQELQKIAESNQKIAELETKLKAFERLEIRAPYDGRILDLAGRLGSNNVKKGDSLFTLVPTTDKLGAILSIPGRDMPLVHVGDKVRLQFQGWPAVQFVGWPSAAVGTFGGIVIAVSPADDTKGDFTILVAPDPDEPAWPDSNYLRQGVRVGGWVLLNQVSLGFEIWRQLNGFPPIITDKEPPKGNFDKKEGESPVKLPK